MLKIKLSSTRCLTNVNESNLEHVSTSMIQYGMTMTITWDNLKSSKIFQQSKCQWWSYANITQCQQSRDAQLD